MSLFTDQFEPLKIPNLGLVRFPEVAISADDRAALGLKPKDTNKTILAHLAWQGYQRLAAKGVFSNWTEDEVKAQFRMEFATFDKTGVHDYLLLVWDYMRWAAKQGIVTGWGRGSAASSITLFTLGITRVNPLRHKLNFPRFISEARMKPVIKEGVVYVDGKAAPDIDCDFQHGRREEVLGYIEEKYAGRTCKISTRMELTGKTALKNVLKIYLGQPDEAAQRVSDFIEAKFGKVQTLAEAKDQNENIKTWLAASPLNQKVYSIAMALEGAPIGKGQHPSGVLIAYYPLDGTVPTELSKEKGGKKAVVTTYDMETIAGIGVKVDVLGVRTLDLVANAAREVGLALEDINIDDPIIYEYLNRPEAHYVGLFQIEEGTTKDAVVQVGPKDIDALSVCAAISRPGALKYLPQYAEYYRKGTLKAIYPAIDAVIGSTGNVLVYQEQITAICNTVFGLSLVDADSVRYAVGKKKREEMVKWEPPLAEGGRARGVPPEVIKYFWDVCNASADYLFCLAHSVSYVYLTAASTYLKAKYPQAFYLWALRLAKEEPDATDYLNTIIGEMRKAGVALLPPDITRSQMDFSIDSSNPAAPCIRFGLASIKGISDATFTKIGALQGRTFETKWDLFDAAKAASIPINMLTGLIYSGTLSWPSTGRIQLALEAQTYNLLSDTQKTKVKGYAAKVGSSDIIEVIKGLSTAKNEKGALLLPTAQLDRIRRDYKVYWDMAVANWKAEDLTHYIMERHYLGFSFSQDLYTIYSRRIVGLTTLDAVKRRGAELAALPPIPAGEPKREQEVFKVIGFVEEIKGGLSKANGTPYYRFTVTDDTGTLPGMIYGDENVESCRSFNGRIPEAGDIVLMTGTLSRDYRMLFCSSAIIQPNHVCLTKKDLPAAPVAPSS